MKAIRIAIDGRSARTTQQWFGNGKTAAANAKQYAKDHGFAFIWRADESGVAYYLDGEKLRQKSYAKVQGYWAGTDLNRIFPRH